MLEVPTCARSPKLTGTLAWWLTAGPSLSFFSFADKSLERGMFVEEE